MLSIQPGGELRDRAVGPSPCLLTMPSHLPLLDESAPSILADGLLCASDFLQVDAGKFLVELKATILSATSLCAENSLLWIAWFCSALAQTGAA